MIHDRRDRTDRVIDHRDISLIEGHVTSVGHNVRPRHRLTRNNLRNISIINTISLIAVRQLLDVNPRLKRDQAGIDREIDFTGAEIDTPGDTGRISIGIETVVTPGTPAT